MDKSFSLLHAFVWTFAMVAILVGGLAAAHSVQPSLAGDAVFMGGWLATVHAVGTLLLLWRHADSSLRSKALGLRATTVEILPIAAAMGVLVHVPMASLTQVIESWFPTPSRVLAERAALLNSDSAVNAAAALVMLGCAAPLFQELFFRGAIYGALRRSSGARVAAVVSGICFVVAHPDVQSWLPVALLAALLSQLRAISGSVLPPLCMHVVYSATTFFLASRGMLGGTGTLVVSWGWAAAGWVGVAAASYAAYRVARGSADSARARAEDIS